MGYKHHKKTVTSFPELHFLPMQCCCTQLAKQKGNPISKTQQSQFCRDLHSEGPLTHWLWHSSAVHLSPYASSWRRAGTRTTRMQPSIGLFPRSPEIILAVQNINTSLRPTLLNTHVALARALLSRGASPSFAWVAGILQRGLCCTASMQWWQKQLQPQVGAFCRGCGGRGQSCSCSPDLLRS